MCALTTWFRRAVTSSGAVSKDVESELERLQRRIRIAVRKSQQDKVTEVCTCAYTHSDTHPCASFYVFCVFMCVYVCMCMYAYVCVRACVCVCV